MTLGILFGLLAAVGQSVSYLATRNYVHRRPAGASRQLLVLGHVWMGLFGLLLLPAAWPGGPLPWAAVGPPLALNVVFYICGQLALATALKHAEASRVSPLMTSKLIVSSVLVLMNGQPVGGGARFLTPLQWLAVALCVVAGISINFAGGRMKARAAAAIAAAAVSFSLSDWGINKTIAALLTAPQIDPLHASLLTESFSYLVTGLLVLPLLPGLGSRRTADWRDAAPFAFTWFVAMIGLFLAFARVGILLGSILQCTRGFITILLAAGIMHLGHHHIEPHAPPRVVLRRLAAGVLMFVGISLYVLRAPAAAPTPEPPINQHPPIPQHRS
jgi:drug/metabolite transporter (DMT)-like permease